MRELNAQPLLTVGATTWTYGDAVLLGLHLGTWQALEERLARGLSLQAARLEPAGEHLTAAIVAFRRERRLHAGEDLRAWLAARRLEPHELQDVLARAVLREAHPATPASAVAEAEVAAHLYAEAVVDGTLQACADALADRAVALSVEPADASEADAAALAAAAGHGPDRGLGSEDLTHRAQRVIAADAALRRFRERAADAERLAERLRERRLALTRVKLDTLELEREHAAREAVLCVRLDGLGIHQVAVRAGVPLEAFDGQLGELDPPLLAGLAAGRPGELIGPLALDDGWCVALMRERHPPSLADDDVRARLASELGDRALARRAAGKVNWHGER